MRVKPLDLTNVIRDAFLAGAGMDTSSKDVQRIPDEIMERLNRYDPDHVPAYHRLEALVSSTYRLARVEGTISLNHHDITVSFSNRADAEAAFDVIEALIT